MKKIIYLLALIIMQMTISLVFADDAVEPTEKPSSLFKSKTFVKNPLDLRDPFKRKMSKRKAQQKKASENGIYTNQLESIENKPIESVRIIGVIIGKERRAMARVGINKEVFFLKEGMKIGPNGAEVKAILPGGVVLVEKIRNVYDQDEYLETVLPVASE